VEGLLYRGATCSCRIQGMEKRFVLGMIECDCNARLFVFCQYSGKSQGRQTVNCPNCKHEREVPSKPMRFYCQIPGQDYWTHVHLPQKK
jgi:hypothetical protein